MPRPLMLILVTISLFFVSMWMFWWLLPPASPAAIKLKDRGEPIKGNIVKKEKYVVVNSHDGQKADVYNWDQIESIQEGPPSLTNMGRAVEWVEFISKLGACLAIGLFILAIYQYTHGQKWEREKFLVGIVKEFRASPKAQSAAQMVDALHQLPSGRRVRLYPDKAGGRQEVFVSNDMVCRALSTTRQDFNQDELAVRECFDAFFNYLESLDHYISTGLVKKRSVYRYSNYWIDLLGKEVHPDPSGAVAGGAACKVCRDVFLYYAHNYEFYGVKKLLNRYTKRYRLSKWLAGTSTAQALAALPPVEWCFKTRLLKFVTGLQNWTRTWQGEPVCRPTGAPAGGPARAPVAHSAHPA